MPKLYHFPLCPFSRRIRLAISEFGAQAELIEERNWERRSGFLKLNPAATLPVLVEDDGAVIAGVEAVSEYLEETRGGSAGGKTLLGNNPRARAEVRRLVAWFDVKFYQEVSRAILFEKVTRRFASPDRAGGAPNMSAVRHALQHIRLHLEYLGVLADHRRWLAGNELTYADLAAPAHISCIDYLGDVPWSTSASAKDWYVRVKSRPGFRPLLADHIRGMPPTRIYADLDF